MYHDIVHQGHDDSAGYSAPGANQYKVTFSRLESHLNLAYREHGSARSVVDLRRDDPDSHYLLTFDDGGMSSIDELLRVLRNAESVGHFFVVTSKIDNPGFLTRDEIRQLDVEGHIVGTHTHTHPVDLHHMSFQKVCEEWATSIEILEGIISSAVTTGSIPFGQYTQKVGRAASESGIEFLFTSNPTKRIFSVRNSVVLGRYTIKRDTSVAEVESILSNRLVSRQRLAQKIAYSARALGKALLGGMYLKIRNRLYPN